jgi:predicted RNA-binding protein with PUA-like domain
MTNGHWLMKTEPDTFSFDDLAGRPGRTDKWEGVRNYQARNFMRDAFQLGQHVFIYHSSTGEPGIIGVAEVVRTAYPDDSALDKKSDYFDEKSLKDGVSRWCMVDVKAIGRFARTISLKELKADKKLKGMALLQPGQRLSIQPVSPKEWAHICGLAELLSLG